MASVPSDATNIDYSAGPEYTSGHFWYADKRRFYVWGNSTDYFNHTELARNWDLLDGLIGRPDDGSKWPSSIGTGGGIWAEIQAVDDKFASRSVPIGTVIFWFRPSTAVPLSYIEDMGWVLCNGQQVLAADHDYTNFSSDFYAPDLRRMLIMGADADTTPGTASTTTNAPGMMTTSASNQQGGKAGASTVAGHSHTIATHTHSVPAHAHGIAQHSHTVTDHVHPLPPDTGQPTYLDSPGHGETVPQGSGAAHRVAYEAHIHKLGGYTYGSGNFPTTVGGPTTTSTDGATTTGGSGTQTTSTSSTIDIRNEHVGLLAFLKVSNP